MLSIDDTMDILGIDLIGVVPEDERILRSSNLGEPAVSDQTSDAGAAYRRVVKRIIGEDIPLHDFSVHTGFFGSLKNLFSKKK